MIKISQKTLDDLEFDVVIQQLSSYAISSLGKTEILALKPYTSKSEAIESLNLVHEFISSFENENRIPNHGFDAITEELKLLRIENNFSENRYIIYNYKHITKVFQKIS
jgi:DNA mismatch repair protein MutS2